MLLYNFRKVGDAYMTIQDACQRLGKSESTIRRMIRDGRLTAYKKEGIYDITEDSFNDLLNDKQSEGDDHSSNELFNQLQSENKYLKERISELESARERADMISLQLTRQLEANQKMLESSQAKQRRSWWQRLKNRHSEETE